MAGAAFASAQHLTQIPLHTDNNALYCHIHTEKIPNPSNRLFSPRGPYLCFDSFQLCSQQLQVTLQALNLEIPAGQKNYCHSVLPQTKGWNQSNHLTNHRLQWKTTGFTYHRSLHSVVQMSDQICQIAEKKRKINEETTKILHIIILLLTCVSAFVTVVPYLWLCLDAGCGDVADLDERLWVVVIVVLLLWFILVRDDHHWFHVFGQRGCVQEVRWGLTTKRTKSRHWLNQ